MHNFLLLAYLPSLFLGFYHLYNLQGKHQQLVALPGGFLSVCRMWRVLFGSQLNSCRSKWVKVFKLTAVKFNTLQVTALNLVMYNFLLGIYIRLFCTVSILMLCSISIIQVNCYQIIQRRSILSFSPVRYFVKYYCRMDFFLLIISVMFLNCNRSSSIIWQST